MNSFGFILDSLLRSLVAFLSQFGVFCMICWRSWKPSMPALVSPGPLRRRKDFMRWLIFLFLSRWV